MTKHSVDAIALDTPLRSRTGYLLIQVGEIAKEAAQEALAPLGLRPRHVNVLATLASSTDPVSQQDLSNALGIDPNVMVGLIDELERLGLAERRRNPNDRRRHVLVVTDAGHVALRSAGVRLDDAEAALFAGVAPEEKAAVHALLDRLLTEATESPDPDAGA